MVAHLVRLKLTLMRNMFRRSRAQSIGALLGVLYFGVLVLGLSVILASLHSSLDAARVVIPLAGAAGTVLWTVVPLFSFGSDPTLDPARFATFAIPPRQLALGLVAGALVGLPSIASALLSFGAVVALSHGPLATATAFAGGGIGLLSAILLSRLVSAVATSAVSSRRGNDVMVLLGLAVLVTVGPIIAVLSNGERDWPGVARQAAEVVSWTPLGWAWASAGDVAAGRLGSGALRLVLAAAFLAVLFTGWAKAVATQVANPRAVSRSDSGSFDAADLGLLGAFPGTPTGAIAARVLTYWKRDPRLQASMLMTPVIPLGLLIPYHLDDVRWTPLLLGPLVAYLLGWMEHNAVSYESTAFWLHVASGVGGRADRLGRIAPNALLAAVLVPLYSVIGVALGGRFDLLAGVVGLSVALLGAGYALSCVMSVLMPYPVPKPGESPFTTPPGAAGVTLLAQSILGVATLVLALPAIGLAWFAWDGHAWATWALLLTGGALGPAFAWTGVRAGAALYERRAPEVLTDLARQ